MINVYKQRYLRLLQVLHLSYDDKTSNDEKGQVKSCRPSMRAGRVRVFTEVSYWVIHCCVSVVERSVTIGECRYVAHRLRYSRTTSIGVVGCTSLAVIELHDIPQLLVSVEAAKGFASDDREWKDGTKST